VTLSIIPIEGIGEIRPGDELAVLIADAARAQGTPLDSRYRSTPTISTPGARSWKPSRSASSAGAAT
jgi:hypothetical protein